MNQPRVYTSQELGFDDEPQQPQQPQQRSYTSAELGFDDEPPKRDLTTKQSWGDTTDDKPKTLSTIDFMANLSKTEQKAIDSGDWTHYNQEIYNYFTGHPEKVQDAMVDKVVDKLPSISDDPDLPTSTKWALRLSPSAMDRQAIIDSVMPKTTYSMSQKSGALIAHLPNGKSYQLESRGLSKEDAIRTGAQLALMYGTEGLGRAALSKAGEALPAVGKAVSRFAAESPILSRAVGGAATGAAISGEEEGIRSAGTGGEAPAQGITDLLQTVLFGAFGAGRGLGREGDQALFQRLLKEVNQDGNAKELLMKAATGNQVARSALLKHLADNADPETVQQLKDTGLLDSQHLTPLMADPNVGRTEVSGEPDTDVTKFMTDLSKGEQVQTRQQKFNQELEEKGRQLLSDFGADDTGYLDNKVATQYTSHLKQLKKRASDLMEKNIKPKLVGVKVDVAPIIDEYNKLMNSKKSKITYREEGFHKLDPTQQKVLNELGQEVKPTSESEKPQFVDQFGYSMEEPGEEKPEEPIQFRSREPDFGVVSDTRQEIGNKTWNNQTKKFEGTITNQQFGKGKNLYGMLKEAQTKTIDSLNNPQLKKDWEQYNALVKQRKDLEDAGREFLGNKMFTNPKPIIPQFEKAAQTASGGDFTQFNMLKKNVPKEDFQQLFASGLDRIFKGGSDENFKTFNKWYNSLSPKAHELFKENLPPEGYKRFQNYAALAKRVEQIAGAKAGKINWGGTTNKILGKFYDFTEAHPFISKATKTAGAAAAAHLSGASDIATAAIGAAGYASDNVTKSLLIPASAVKNGADKLFSNDNFIYDLSRAIGNKEIAAPRTRNGLVNRYGNGMNTFLDNIGHKQAQRIIKDGFINWLLR